MSLVARHLEANSIATVVLGSALDVVEYCGVPRFLFVDFPLGNPCGKPYDRKMQLAIVRQAVNLFDTVETPSTTAQTPFNWSDDESWRDTYARVDDSNRAALLLKGEQRRKQQQAARSAGDNRAPMIPE